MLKIFASLVCLEAFSFSSLEASPLSNGAQRSMSKHFKRCFSELTSVLDYFIPDCFDAARPDSFLPTL